MRTPRGRVECIPSATVHDDEQSSKSAGKKSDQIGFYNGETRTILENAKHMIRIYLATDDLYPSVADIHELVSAVFDEACVNVLGKRVKRM